MRQPASWDSPGRRRKRVCIQRVTGSQYNPLLTVQQVGDRAVGLRGTGPEVPQDFALIGAEGNQVTLVIAGEHQVACRAQQSRAQGSRSAVEVGVLMLPPDFTRVDINSLQESCVCAQDIDRAAVA